MSTQTDVYRAAFALLDGLKTHEDKGHEGERLGECVIVAQRAALGDALHAAYADDAISEEDQEEDAENPRGAYLAEQRRKDDEHSHEGDAPDLYRGVHSHPYQATDNHVHAPDWRPL